MKNYWKLLCFPLWSNPSDFTCAWHESIFMIWSHYSMFIPWVWNLYTWFWSRYISQKNLYKSVHFCLISKKTRSCFWTRSFSMRYYVSIPFHAYLDLSNWSSYEFLVNFWSFLVQIFIFAEIILPKFSHHWFWTFFLAKMSSNLLEMIPCWNIFLTMSFNAYLVEYWTRYFNSKINYRICPFLEYFVD